MLYTQNANQSNSQINDTGSPQRVGSSLPTRIKSALPLNYDKDKLVEENLFLKNQLNKIKNDILISKKEINNLEDELSKKDKMLEEIISETQNSMYNPNDATSLIGKPNSSLLIANKVRFGLVTRWFFAVIPTNFSPLSVYATIEGVVLSPSLLVITFGTLPSSMATHELVVPKSIPIIASDI